MLDTKPKLSGNKICRGSGENVKPERENNAVGTVIL
jgi:hypothetical protein